MKIFNKVYAVLSALGMFFSAVLYVLLKQSKDERKTEQAENRAENLERKLKEEQAAHTAQMDMQRKKTEMEKKDEQTERKMRYGYNLASYDAGIDLLRESAKRGQQRNSNKSGNYR